MRTIGCLFLAIVVIAFYGCKKPAPPPADLPPPPPSTPLNSDKLKQIAALIESRKAEWLQALGEPVREIPPGDTLPRDAGETDWEFDGDIEVDVSWLHTKMGVLPWDIAFVRINGAPDSSLLEMDLLAGFFGLSRSKSDDERRQYEWSRPDGSLSAEYFSDDPELSGLQIYVEKPGGEPVPSALDELQRNPAKKGSPETHVGTGANVDSSNPEVVIVAIVCMIAAYLAVLYAFWRRKRERWIILIFTLVTVFIAPTWASAAVLGAIFSKIDQSKPLNSNKKLELMMWSVTGCVFVTCLTLTQLKVIPLWVGIAITIASLTVNGLVGCLIMWCLLGPTRYLDFIQQAKVEQNELLAARALRRETKRKQNQ